MDTSRTLDALGRDLALAMSLPAPPASTLISTAVLGELQASFLLFLLGQSLEALEVWKHRADVVCRAEDALRGSPLYFVIEL
jgi:hypothetical protein